ncbi:MAG: hypothetical protein QE278_00305 [Limnobacter sp.]|nr:hypothetical protein [Limnobacter sp.]
MQTIHLSAAPGIEPRRIQNKTLLSQAKPLNTHVDMDDTLAEVLRVMNAHGGPKGMKALGDLLGYMEQLEKNQAERREIMNIVLVEPLTLTM